MKTAEPLIGVADALTLQVNLSNKAISDTLIFMIDQLSVNNLDALISKITQSVLDNGIVDSRCFHITGIERDHEGKYLVCFHHRLEEIFDLVPIEKLPVDTQLLIIRAIEDL